MTREEILRSMEYALESDKRTIKNPISEYGWLFDKIYKWKKSLEQEPCEDVISREVVQKWYCQNCCGRGKHNCSYYPCNEIKDILNLPSVTPKQKVGRWILSGGYWRCSNCNQKTLLKLDKSKSGYREYAPIKSNYCPNCGQPKIESKEP